MRTCRLCGRTASCGCAFNPEGICKICATLAQGLEKEAVPLDIRMELSTPTLASKKASINQPTIVHFGFNNDLERTLIQRYAQSVNGSYHWEGLKNDLFKAADTIKRASLVVIWNGNQHGSPLVARLCRRRGIPHVFLEWGLLPQSETFLVDPSGFCGDSILTRDLSWVNATDRENLANKRTQLLTAHPRREEGFVLVPLQIESDSQILYHCPYNTMSEFVEHIEAMYPNQRIVVRPHPKGNKTRRFARAETVSQGSFLDWASRASVVVGITSTCLYEAAVLGVPVVALGDHPLRSHAPRLHNRVAAGVLSLSIRRDGELRPVLERFGIKPLEVIPS